MKQIITITLLLLVSLVSSFANQAAANEEKAAKNKRNSHPTKL